MQHGTAAVGATMQNDDQDAVIQQVGSEGLTVLWDEGCVQTYTWEEVEEYGFTFPTV